MERLEHLINGSYLLTKDGQEISYDHNGKRFLNHNSGYLLLTKEQINSAIHEQCVCAINQKVNQ